MTTPSKDTNTESANGLQPSSKLRLEKIFLPHVGWLEHERGDDVATALIRGVFEPAEQAFLWCYLRDRDTVIDCGAHIGVFTLTASRICDPHGAIFAIEPNPITGSILRRNLQANDAGNVTFIEAALAASDGQMSFMPGDLTKSAYSHLAFNQTQRDGINVKTLTLETLFRLHGLKSASFLKIDAEGAELEILRGSHAVFSKGLVEVAMIELTPGNLHQFGVNPSDIFETFRKWGYHLYHFDPAQKTLVEKQFDPSISYTNYFAIRDIEAVKHRLATASHQRLQIAQDIVTKASVADDLDKERLHVIAEQKRFITQLQEQVLNRQTDFDFLRAQFDDLAATTEKQVSFITQLQEQVFNRQTDFDFLRAQFDDLATTAKTQTTYIALLEKRPLPTVDLIITANEINNSHGVGIFLQRIFGTGQDFLCVRSRTMYGGDEPFGSHHCELRSLSLTVSETECRLKELLGGFTVRRILCVPYFREDFIHATLAKKLTGAPLCTFLMDDQNIFAQHVTDTWVDRLLRCSDFRLGISQEMCAAYEAKFCQPFYLMPPVVERAEDLVPCYWTPESYTPLRCAMIGNIWTAHRLTQLRALLRETGVHVDWYGNGPRASWLQGETEAWEQDNLHCMDFLSERDLIASLASYPFILVPSGTVDDKDDNPAFSLLSLPSRLLFLHARTDTPVIVLGSPKTAAGHFVRRLGTGLCSSYNAKDFLSKIAAVIAPSKHARLRRNIRRIAFALVLEQGGEWLWHSLAARTPRPSRFSKIFPKMKRSRSSEVTFGIERFKNCDTALSTDSSNEAFLYGYSQKRMLPELIAKQLLPNVPSEEIEILDFMRAAAVQRAAKLVQADSDILFLGETVPDSWALIAPPGRLWRMANFAAWRDACNPAFQASFELITPTTGDKTPPPAFRMIWSSGVLDQIPQQPAAYAQFSAFCDSVTQPGGWNSHVFSAVLHPNYFWIHPLHAYLRNRFIGRNPWPGIDELLADESAFFMSEQVYNQRWRPSMLKSYQEFGRICWMGITWVKPQFALKKT
jgi:FkbM family methyltransferase